MATACVTVISRLRKDAALSSVPTPPPRGARRRGRPRKHGEKRIDLAKRDGQSRGWQSETFLLYGREVTKRFKTFLAAYPPAGGLIKVVLVKNEDGSRVAFFCTDASASVKGILEAVADRAAIEQVFRDVKEVHRAGQSQLRNVWANIAAWHLALWLFTLVELWAWRRSHASLVSRKASPWDDATRRPSHADRCKAFRRECLEQDILTPRDRRSMEAKNPGLLPPPGRPSRVPRTNIEKCKISYAVRNAPRPVALRGRARRILGTIRQNKPKSSRRATEPASPK